MATPRCVGAMVCRNEAAPDRYLSRVLANVHQFCDEIVVLDDHSTDDTAQVCRTAGATVHARSDDGVEGWWGASGSEAPARAELWQIAASTVTPADWIYIVDADHELIGIRPPEFRRLLTAQAVTAWACPLLDCWNDDQHMRCDGYWQAHLRPRAWLARAFPAPQWSDRVLHVGHLPNLPWCVGVMPDGTYIRHLGYCQEQHRVAKRAAYLQTV